MSTEGWNFTLALDRDQTQMITFDLELVPYNCIDIGSLSRCDLSGMLIDPGTDLEYPVSGRRSLVDGRGAIRLEFTFNSLRFIYIGAHHSASEFDGKFVCLFREGMKSGEVTAAFDPSEGDTGTGTGTQTLLKSDERNAAKGQMKRDQS